MGLSPGQLANADGWSVALSAQYSNWLILALAGLFIAIVAVAVASYLREGSTPRRVKLGLAILRSGVVLLVLLLLFEPVLLLKYRRDSVTTVAVVVDDSLSMGLADGYADAQRRAELSARLKLPPADVDKRPRSQIAHQVLADGPLAALAKDHELLVGSFSTSQPAKEPYSRVLAALPAGEKNAAPAIRSALSKLSSSGYETDLAQALRDASERLTGRRSGGVVLVSDGQATSEDAANRLSSALAYLRQRGINVYAVSVGEPTPPPSVSLARVQAPTEVQQHATLEFLASLSHRHAAGQKVTLELFRRGAGQGEWGSPVATQVVELSASDENGASQDVPLFTDAPEMGEFEYRLQLANAQGLRMGSSDATARVNVNDRKLKVLFVSGDAGWEMLYLRNLLLRDVQRYAVSVWQQNAESDFNQEASSGMQLSQLPRTPKELFEYDVIILYDPAQTTGGFDKDFAGMLDAFVGEHHGGLCYIASNKYSQQNLIGNDAFAALQKVLPVELGVRAVDIAAEISRAEPVVWPVVPTQDGLESPILRLGRNPQDSQAIWSMLPGLYWQHPVARPKPLANVLAVTGQRRADGSGELTPLLAVQFYGKGRSLFVGSDETWRWRQLADGAYYRRFWSNVMDFLAAGRMEKKRVVISAGGDRFRVGQEIRISAEAYDENYTPLAQESFDVDVVNAQAGTSRQITLPRSANQPGRYEGRLTLAEPGAYELSAKMAGEGAKNDVAGKSLVVTLPEEEFLRPEANPAMLESIAPGRTLGIERADELAKLIPPGKLSVQSQVSHNLYDVPAVLILIVLLLGCEWILRKRHNMI